MLEDDALFHITTARQWAAARQRGEYRAPSLDHEGFVHLSTRRQWARTLYRFYRHERHLVLLEIVPARLTTPVRYERADGEDFPHLYGALALDAVAAIHDVPHVDATLDEAAFVARVESMLA